jgi:hypothetical protein
MRLAQIHQTPRKLIKSLINNEYYQYFGDKLINLIIFFSSQ